MDRFLADRDWDIGYSSDQGNPIADFYIPALERSVQYDRKAGFFNSSILSRVASGLGAMLENCDRFRGHGPIGPRIRLIVGCQFSPQDLQAIRQGYDLRRALGDRLDQQLQPPTTLVQLKHFEILGWLIQAGYLDMRVAIPLATDGDVATPDRALDLGGLFHEKVGIFTDARGDRLAFSGSNNESLGGWQVNVESFHVFPAWEGGKELARVNYEAARFEDLWGDRLNQVRVFDVPEAVKQKLVRYASAQRPTWTPQTEWDDQPLSDAPVAQSSEAIEDAVPEPMPAAIPEAIDPAQIDRERAAFAELLAIRTDPACLDFCLRSIPIRPWPHQLKILYRVAAEFPRSFLIADEVGLGKTIETGLILRYLIVSQRVRRVLVLSPASVQPQWQEELREKFNLHFWSYDKGELRDPYGNDRAVLSNPWNSCELMLASSHLVRRQDRIQELLAAEPWDLVVLDEAHHARRKSPQTRQDKPNRLLELLRQLRDHSRSLLLLSATPMQIDPIEVFDLLSVLGLTGLWANGDLFCDYFASLGDRPNADTLDFWQSMAAAYGAAGGQPCPRLQQHLERSDRLLARRVKNTWTNPRAIVNHRQYLDDEAFIIASRQYLVTNTPLKDLMFRHTRDTLRAYYRLGLLDRDVAQRHVCDEAISLEPLREVPLYRAVSDYVRHFYNLANKENRKALGFLMTLYRKRLTSSFYAVQRSLARRLESLLVGQGSSLTPDDLSDLDDADDAVLDGLGSYLEPAHPEELDYLKDLLQQLETTGEDSKLAHLLKVLREELNRHDSAIIFTQYTDTMDYLRDTLRQVYGAQVACYSGRGGERFYNQAWVVVAKEEIKHQFRNGEIKLLLCTESASEGLNLQTCGLLINYDLPWNPMRVEQRIGRIDRIGQTHPIVTIRNFYYDGTVEAKVYGKLRDRINAFTTVVGNLQPILAQVPTFIEQAAFSADPQEEDVLLAQFERVLEMPPLRPSLDEMVAMDVAADLAELEKPIPQTNLTPEAIEHLFTTAKILKSLGIHFQATTKPKIWELIQEHDNSTRIKRVTFDPATFDQHPSLQLMTWGNSLVESILAQVLTP